MLTAVGAIIGGLVAAFVGFRICQWAVNLNNAVARAIFSALGVVLMLGLGTGPILFGVFFGIMQLSFGR